MFDLISKKWLSNQDKETVLLFVDTPDMVYWYTAVSWDVMWSLPVLKSVVVQGITDTYHNSYDTSCHMVQQGIGCRRWLCASVGVEKLQMPRNTLVYWGNKVPDILEDITRCILEDITNNSKKH